ncbi:hypothetical protein ACFQ14_14165 [Pseudahrensia aquimaris]|uniref:Uncharacterized protein n=1 Tax=Pseudahrensia aquimaris TaxID=744461 RepID=A0ABW3FGC9_9HYPH
MAAAIYSYGSSRRAPVRAFDPFDPDEIDARDRVRSMLLLIVVAFAIIFGLYLLIMNEHAPDGVRGAASLSLPLLAFVWETLRFLFIGPLPANKLHTLKRFRSLHTRVSLRAAPFLFAAGILWADTSNGLAVFLYECATFGTLLFVLLTFGLRHAYLNRKRDIIKSAQRFAYG